MVAVTEGSRQAKSAAKYYIDSWDEYFLAISEMVACKSKDPRCQVGAVLVAPDNVIISTGFNGLARGVFDDKNVLGDTDEKLKWVCHAEVNAILNAGRLGVPLKNCSIYVNKFPCFGCCNAIVQAGIGRIYTHDQRYWDDDPFDPNHVRKRELLKQSHLKVEAPFHPEYIPQPQITRKQLVEALSIVKPKPTDGRAPAVNGDGNGAARNR